jgi:hypothetical protein
VLLACTDDQEQLLFMAKPDGPVWHSGLSSFHVSRPSCPAGGRRIHNGRLVHTRLRGQNPQQVLTILGGSALAVAPMARTTSPKVDKGDMSYPVFMPNQVLNVCMTRDQLFHTYDLKCLQITKHHE